MFLDKKPDFIYDHNLKIVGIKNDKNQLELYSQNKLSNFTSNYWANWYGQDSVNVINQKISAEDHIFTLKSGKTISLNYWKCLDADVQIITSKKLHCSGDAQIIQNEDIWKHKQILLYCDSPLSCKIEYKE